MMCTEAGAKAYNGVCDLLGASWGVLCQGPDGLDLVVDTSPTSITTGPKVREMESGATVSMISRAVVRDLLAQRPG